MPVSHHLLLCATPSKALCCPDPTVGAASWDALKQLVRQLGLEDPTRTGGIVLRSKADCLRICTDGPVLLIWPDGVVYGGVTPERIERILREHLLEGCPIPDWIVRDYSLRESGEQRSAQDGPHGRIPAGPHEIDR
ncbi:MAG: (2Fe-2S) ferredoxin domain-containing protein [Cyanobacteriota bacterium]|nr:(2Fe-2S) ferredoxin domain-containing protein [Cyanobacteriota bacterium]